MRDLNNRSKLHLDDVFEFLAYETQVQTQLIVRLWKYGVDKYTIFADFRVQIT